MNYLGITTALAISISLGKGALAGDWTVGVAALYSDGPYTESQTQVAPLIMYERDRLSVSTLDGVSYRLMDLPEKLDVEGNFSILATPRIAPDYGESSDFSDINRKHGLDIGVISNLTYGNFAMEIRGLSDITSANNGFEISTELKYQSESLPAELGIGFRYRDKNLNQYLFGIDPTESTDALPAYSAPAELTGFVTGMVAAPLTKGLIGYSKFVLEDLGLLTNSPLVSNEFFSEVMVGVIYQWR